MTPTRPISLGVFIFGLTASFAWAWWQITLFNQSVPKLACGLPILGIYIVAVLGAGTTSLASTALNFHSFRYVPKPRPLGRIIELVVLAAPAVFSVVLIGALFLVG